MRREEEKKKKISSNYYQSAFLRNTIKAASYNPFHSDPSLITCVSYSRILTLLICYSH